ncbi:O-fucosyltransferase family protein [Allorhizobium undicola]|uniref:hypothetical protein n=1 Tax=Allorhizobium undicola TaxID=78527 RepID=UPI0004885C73|nr:hypothetical protein [Allorhizobium undicola]
MIPHYIAPVRTAGLNNVKLVFFGMTHLASMSGGISTLPESIFDFTPTEEGIGDQYIPLCDVFDPALMSTQFALTHPRQGDFIRLGNADYIKAAQEAIDQEAGCSGIERSPVAKAFAAFAPTPALQGEIDRITNSLPPQVAAMQLRIERDWLAYAQRKGWRDGAVKGGCETVLNHYRIFDKIAASEEGITTIFACCDEDDLTIPPDVIRQDAKERGIDLIFKSDFVINCTSRLQRSVIDFGICLKLNKYVGTPRSTFSNILCMVKAFEISSAPEHYVFDAASEKIERRWDCGRMINPARAIMRIGNEGSLE